jgi:hypothetical protein
VKVTAIMQRNINKFHRLGLGIAALAASLTINTSAFAQSGDDPGPSPHADGWRTTILEEND